MPMSGEYFDANYPGGDSLIKDMLRLAVVPTTYDGDPTNNLTPAFLHQFCEDTSGNHLYWASTTASSGWKKLNN